MCRNQHEVEGSVATTLLCREIHLVTNRHKIGRKWVVDHVGIQESTNNVNRCGFPGIVYVIADDRRIIQSARRAGKSKEAA